MHQSFVYNKTRLHALYKSTIEQSLIDDAKIIRILTQISYNTQKINEETSKKVNNKKNN